MLPLFSSPTPFASGLVEHACPRCQREVELPLGALCRICRREIDKRASRVGLLVSGITTAAVAAYVFLRMPEENQMARNVGLAGILVWFVLVHTTVRRVMREWTR